MARNADYPQAIIFFERHEMRFVRRKMPQSDNGTSDNNHGRKKTSYDFHCGQAR